MQRLSRRGILASAAALRLARSALAQATPIRIGLMLPFSGAEAAIGETIAAAFELSLQEHDIRLGGRAVCSDPPRRRVRSGEGGGERQTPARRRPCGRSGRQRASPGHNDDGAGGTRAHGAADHPARRQQRRHTRSVCAVDLPQPMEFPDTHFLPVFSVLSGIGVDAVGAFFAGDTAAQFVKDYATTGLHGKIPLCGWGFLTEGASGAQGAAADGIRTALHYGDGVDNAKNTAFRAAFKQKVGRDADVYAVQGYDAARCWRSVSMRRTAMPRRSSRWRRRSWRRRSTARAAHPASHRRTTRSRRTRLPIPVQAARWAPDAAPRAESDAMAPASPPRGSCTPPRCRPDRSRTAKSC